MHEVEDVENEQLNVLEIVVGHRVDEHIKDDTLCKPDVNPIVIERLVVWIKQRQMIMINYISTYFNILYIESD